MKKGRLSAALAAGLAVVMMFGMVPAFAGGTKTDDDGDRQVSVSAQGIVMEVPDMAQIAFSVTTEGSEAETAQTENTEKVNAVMAALDGLGVDKGSIQTSGYSISPEYNYDKDPAELAGYTVRTSLTVSDQKIEDAGKIISEAVKAGVNDIDGVVYTCSTYDDKYQEALTLAVEAAKKKADTLAAASGAKAGKVLSLSEGYQDLSARYQESNAYDSVAMKSQYASEDAMAAPDLSAGSLQITAEVNVIYELEY